MGTKASSQDKREGKKVRVKQIRSLCGRSVDFKRTANTLGLGKIGTEKVFTLNPSLRGALKKVETIISLTEEK